MYFSAKYHTHPPPFRAENVGSFLRPAPLYAARKEMAANECTFDDLKNVEDQAIKQVVKLQGDVGIKTITDGELRRFRHPKASG
jgi:methionine synthase II (cobalamin-independent)